MFKRTRWFYLIILKKEIITIEYLYTERVFAVNLTVINNLNVQFIITWLCQTWNEKQYQSKNKIINLRKNQDEHVRNSIVFTGNTTRNQIFFTVL